MSGCCGQSHARDGHEGDLAGYISCCVHHNDGWVNNNFIYLSEGWQPEQDMLKLLRRWQLRRECRFKTNDLVQRYCCGSDRESLLACGNKADANQ